MQHASEPGVKEKRLRARGMPGAWGSRPGSRRGPRSRPAGSAPSSALARQQPRVPAEPGSLAVGAGLPAFPAGSAASGLAPYSSASVRRIPSGLRLRARPGAKARWALSSPQRVHNPSECPPRSRSLSVPVPE